MLIVLQQSPGEQNALPEKLPNNGYWPLIGRPFMLHGWASCKGIIE